MVLTSDGVDKNGMFFHLMHVMNTGATPLRFPQLLAACTILKFDFQNREELTC